MACPLTGAQTLSNPSWNIIVWTLGNKPQWNRNLQMLVEKNPFHNAAWKMTVIMSRPDCVKHAFISHGFGSLVWILLIFKDILYRYRTKYITGVQFPSIILQAVFRAQSVAIPSVDYDCGCDFTLFGWSVVEKSRTLMGIQQCTYLEKYIANNCMMAWP